MLTQKLNNTRLFHALLLTASVTIASRAVASVRENSPDTDASALISLQPGTDFSCRPPAMEPASRPLPGRCIREDASFILQTPLDRPESLIVGWDVLGAEFIGGLMRMLAQKTAPALQEGAAPSLVVLVSRDQLSEAHARLSKFPEYATLRSGGRLLLRPTRDNQNLWLQDAMEIGWNPRSGKNSVADLPHFAADNAARSVAVACGLEEGPFFASHDIPAASISDTSRNHGGNLEGLPGNLLLHGRGTSAQILKELQAADPSLETLPVETNWLEVGHVDELFAVIPTGSEGGGKDRCAFALLRASPGLGLELATGSKDAALEPKLRDFRGAAPEARTTGTCMDRFKTAYVGSPLLAKDALECRAFSQSNLEFEGLIAGEAERIREAISRRTGCSSVPIIRLPALFLSQVRASSRALQFEETHGIPASTTYREAGPLNPNPVNGISLGDTLIVPEQPNEAFRNSILESLKRTAPAMRVEFLPTHHLHFLKGEAHCGSQVIRSCTSEL